MRFLLLGLLMSPSFAAAAALPPLTPAEKAYWDKVFDGQMPRPASDLAIPTSPAVPSSNAVDSRALAVIRAEQSNLADPVWPGFKILGQPILIYEAGVRSSLIGHTNPPPGYHAVLAKPQTVFVQDGSIADLQFAFQYHRPVNGVDTFAYRYEKAGREDQDTETIIHERFHIHQEKGFQDMHAPENEVDPDGELLALAALEQQALKAALNADDPMESSRHARQFLAIRKARYQAQPGLEKGEATQERVEGTAEYISRNLMARPGVLAQPKNAIDELSRRLDQYPDVDSMSKGRFYGTGGAQGFLLDRGGPRDWKKRVAAGETPYDLMALSYPGAQDLAQAKSELGYRALLKAGRKIAQAYQGEKDKAIKAYENGPGLELRFDIDWSKKVDFGFSAGGPHYRLKDGADFVPGMRVIDVRGEGFAVHAKKRPAVISPGVRFRIEKGVVSQGDGTHPFQTLSLKGEGFEVTCSKPGTLTVQGRTVTVRLLP